MMLNSVDDIFAFLNSTRGQLISRLHALTEVERETRSAPEAWAARDIAEHLLLTESRVTKMLQDAVAEAENAQQTPNDGGEPFAPFSLKEALAKPEVMKKLQAPEFLRPKGERTLEELTAEIENSRSALQSLRPRIMRLNLGGVTRPHPALGEINIYYWLAFIGAHEMRHLKQIEKTLGTVT